VGCTFGRVWPTVVGLLSAFLASWLGVAALLIFSVAGQAAARFLLLVWALVVAGWCAVYAGRLRPKVSWWAMALMAPALPLIGAVAGLRRRAREHGP
jgi:hypothetical protein